LNRRRSPAMPALLAGIHAFIMAWRFE